MSPGTKEPPRPKVVAFSASAEKLSAFSSPSRSLAGRGTEGERPPRGTVHARNGETRNEETIARGDETGERRETNLRRAAVLSPRGDARSCLPLPYHRPRGFFLLPRPLPPLCLFQYALPTLRAGHGVGEASLFNLTFLILPPFSPPPLARVIVLPGSHGARICAIPRSFHQVGHVVLDSFALCVFASRRPRAVLVPLSLPRRGGGGLGKLARTGGGDSRIPACAASRTRTCVHVGNAIMKLCKQS